MPKICSPEKHVTNLIEADLDKAYKRLEEARELVRVIHASHFDCGDELEIIDMAMDAVKEITVGNAGKPVAEPAPETIAAAPPEQEGSDPLSMLSETSLCCGGVC